MNRRITLLFAACTFFISSTAQAFDYLEHSYFTDLACSDALASSLEHLSSEKDAARFVALSLFCPAENLDQYCKDGYKYARSRVNLVEHREFGITLGDIAALPDHVSRYGPIRNVQRAGEGGLSASLLDWISDEGEVGGVIEDVAEDACEYDREIGWEELNRQIRADVRAFEEKGLPRIHPSQLSPIARRAPQKGPNDPATKYTLDNPHYLDLVLRNHTHFGASAYDSWLGFHQLGKQIAERQCEDVVDFSDDEIEDLAENLDKDNKDWSDLNDADLRKAGCALIADALTERVKLMGFASSKSQALRSFVKKLLAGDVEARDSLSSATFGTLFRGAGLHFLQDGLAGGHLRTIRSRESLSEVRHDHDVDNEAGVIAIYSTANSKTPFIAFGDSYLLGARFGDSQCRQMTKEGKIDDGDVTDCLLRLQRAILVGTSSQNLVQFLLGKETNSVFLPSQKVSVPGEVEYNPTKTHAYGSLPVPAPTFSFESLSMRLGFSTRDSSPQLGIKMEALSELDDPAHWMVGYQLGLNYQPRYNEAESLFLDFAYAFHYRFFARATLDLVPAVYGGVYGLGDNVEPFFGFAPTIGITLLPEGWIEMPLEFSIAYRLPIDLYSGQDGFKFGILEDHWIQLGFGLAFMH